MGIRVMDSARFQLLSMDRLQECLVLGIKRQPSFRARRKTESLPGLSRETSYTGEYFDSRQQVPFTRNAHREHIVIMPTIFLPNTH